VVFIDLASSVLLRCEDLGPRKRQDRLEAPIRPAWLNTAESPSPVDSGFGRVAGAAVSQFARQVWSSPARFTPHQAPWHAAAGLRQRCKAWIAFSQDQVRFTWGGHSRNSISDSPPTHVSTSATNLGVAELGFWCLVAFDSGSGTFTRAQAVRPSGMFSPARLEFGVLCV